MCASITYEISRKTWPEEREHELADSYSKFWGRGKAVAVSQIVALAASAGIAFVFLGTPKGLVSTIVQFVFYLMFMVAGLYFLKKPTIKSSKALEGAGAFFVLSFFANVAISFYIITQGR